MATVREGEIIQYLEVFIEEFTTLGNRYLPKEAYDQLLRASLYSSKITVYISTQFGVGFVYEKADKITIEAFHGSKRIEDLVFGTPKSVQKLMTMFSIGGSNCSVESVTLDGGYPIRLINNNASVRLKEVRFRALGWEKNIEYAEIYGEKDYTHWTLSEARCRATQEILLALSDVKIAQNQNVNLSTYIEEVKNKNVLVLGSYSGDAYLKLEQIIRQLKVRGYNPVLVKDIPDNLYQNLRQKVVTLGSLSRFIILDDSEPAGQIMEVELCKNNEWVTVIVRPNGSGSSFMTLGVSKTSKVINEIFYYEENLVQSIDEGIDWAECLLHSLKQNYNDYYPWRKQ